MSSWIYFSICNTDDGRLFCLDSNEFWKYNILYWCNWLFIKKRIYEHKNKCIPGFSSKYDLKKLVYYETVADINSAITREKPIKNWRRDWKTNLIINKNPSFIDLSASQFQFPDIIDPEINLAWQIQLLRFYVFKGYSHPILDPNIPNPLKGA